MDVYPDEDRPRGWESVRHYWLEDCEHSLGVVVRGEPCQGSEDSDIALTHLGVSR